MTTTPIPAPRVVGRIRYNTRYLAREAAAGTVAHIGSDARALMLAMNDQRRAPEMTERDRSALLARAAVLRERISSFEEQLNGLIESDPQAEYLPTGEGNPEPGPVDDAGVSVEGEQGVGHVADAGGLLGVGAVRVSEEGDVSGGEVFPDLLDVNVADVPGSIDAVLQLVGDVVDGRAEFRVQFVPLPLGDEVDGLAHGASPSKGDGAVPGRASTASVEGDPAAGAGDDPVPAVRALTRMLGPAVKAMRELAGIKQSDLAIACDISPGFLSNIEAGREQPSPVVARAMANRLGVPIDAISYALPDCACTPTTTAA